MSSNKSMCTLWHLSRENALWGLECLRGSILSSLPPSLPPLAQTRKHISTLLSPRKAKKLCYHGDSFPAGNGKCVTWRCLSHFHIAAWAWRHHSQLREPRLRFAVVIAACPLQTPRFNSFIREAERSIRALNKQSGINEDYRSAVRWLFLLNKYHPPTPPPPLMKKPHLHSPHCLEVWQLCFIH